MTKDEELKARLAKIRQHQPVRTNRIKDQSGVAASAAWLAARPKIEAVDETVTEQIDGAHYLRVRRAGKCLACGCGLSHSTNAGSAGSLFMICSGCGWYIGYRMAKGHGHQARVEQWQERAA